MTVSPRRFPFALLVALAALGPISTDLYLPSLPSIGLALSASQAETQATLSLFLLGFAASVLVSGPLSDHFGRRPVLLSALSLFILGSLLCVLASSIHLLWLARLLQALGAGAGPVVTRAIIRDTHQPQESIRMNSYLSAGVAVAPLIGPSIGGLLQTAFGWQANFLFLGLYGIAGLGCAWRQLNETNQYIAQETRSIGTMLTTYTLLLRDRRYRGYVLCAAFSYSGMFCFISSSSFVLIGLMGVPPHYFGFCFALFVLGFMSGASLSGWLTRRVASETILLTGISIASLASMALVLVALLHASLLILLLPLYPYMLGLGMVSPSAQALAIGPRPQIAGAASGLLSFLSLGCASLIGALLGQIAITSALPMNIFMALCVLATFIAYWRWVRPSKA